MAGKQYEEYVQKGKPWWKFVTGILFSHLGLFVLCITYGVVGALIFIEIELPAEKERFQTKMDKTKEVDSAVEYLKTMFWLYANDEDKFNHTRESFHDQVKLDLETLKKFVISYNGDYGYDMTGDWDYSWTFSKTLLFTITIMTTIGYGNISPVTTMGKVFCIFYALIGIPLLLVFLNDIGDLMGKLVKWLYSRLCCRWCRVRRRDSELPPLIDRKSKSIRHDEVGKESYMPTDLINVPIVFNLVIMFVFLFIGALLFSEWEGWGTGEAFYFCFITLTTVGFGDLVPNKAFLEAGETFWGTCKMMITIIYIIFGIMLLSLALNLMQEQVMVKVRNFASAIGMNGSENKNEEMVKITKEERLKMTPADMTGNELDFNERRLAIRQRYFAAHNQGNKADEENLIEDSPPMSATSRKSSMRSSAASRRSARMSSGVSRTSFKF